MNDAGISKDVKLLKYCLVLLAFSLPISISVAEPFAFLSILCWFVCLRKKEFRTVVRSNPLLLPVALFVLVAIVVSLFWGLRPLTSLDKFHRLSFLLLAFAVEAGLTRKETQCTLDKVMWTVTAFFAGCTVLGAYDLVRVPLYAYNGGDIYDAGNMRDPQFYLVALCILVAMWTRRRASGKVWLWMLALFLNGAGLLLHFKRGVWIAFCFSMLLIAIKTKRWKILAGIVLCAALMMCFPQVRERLARLREVTEVQTGGRYVLWNETAPALFAAYPAGMGWCCVTHEDLMTHSEHPVQAGLNHLHNNLLQMRLELGWVGAGAWILLMATVLALFFIASLRRGGEHSDCSLLSLGLLAGFVGLLVNGMVEANFNDTEIMMLFGLLMGFSVVLWRIRKEFYSPRKST